MPPDLIPGSLPAQLLQNLQAYYGPTVQLRRGYADSGVNAGDSGMNFDSQTYEAVLPTGQVINLNGNGAGAQEVLNGTLPPEVYPGGLQAAQNAVANYQADYAATNQSSAASNRHFQSGQLAALAAVTGGVAAGAGGGAGLTDAALAGGGEVGSGYAASAPALGGGASGATGAGTMLNDLSWWDSALGTGTEGGGGLLDWAGNIGTNGGAIPPVDGGTLAQNPSWWNSALGNGGAAQAPNNPFGIPGITTGDLWKAGGNFLVNQLMASRASNQADKAAQMGDPLSHPARAPFQNEANNMVQNPAQWMQTGAFPTALTNLYKNNVLPANIAKSGNTGFEADKAGAQFATALGGNYNQLLQTLMGYGGYNQNNFAGMNYQTGNAAANNFMNESFRGFGNMAGKAAEQVFGSPEKPQVNPTTNAATMFS